MAAAAQTNTCSNKKDCNVTEETAQTAKMVENITNAGNMAVKGALIMGKVTRKKASPQLGLKPGTFSLH